MRNTIFATPATHLALSLAVGLALIGCDDPASDVAQAVVHDPAPSGDLATADQPEEPVGTPTELAIDTARSTFEFVGSKVTGSHTGHFGEWSGAMSFRPGALPDSSVRITMQMATIEADVDRLTNHLRTDDFFDVEQFPTGTFESTGVVAAPAGTANANYLITGRLTLRGHAETVTFPAQIDVSDGEVRARAEFSINRQQWGITYAGMEDDLIRDDVVIRFDVRAPRG